MNGINCEVQIESHVSVEEKILINEYHNSDALKEQIRKITASYSQKGLSLISIISKGGFLFLKFSSPK